MNDDIINSLKAERSEASKSHIMVIGVGGAGGNAVNHMYHLGIKDVDFMVCNTDQQALDISPIELKVRLGEDGLGAGNDPAVGRRAAITSLDMVKQIFENFSTKMIFITAGMGGGTGTGASPVIAKAAREMGILTVGIVTSPLKIEGHIRYKQAMAGIEEMKSCVDSLLIINNDNIMAMGGRMTVDDAFSLADDVLASAAKGIAEIITIKSPRTNIDFADVSKVMTNSGRTHMGVGRANGEDRAETAARNSLRSPLLDHNSIRGAKNILLNISCNKRENMMYHELTTILEVIQSEAKYTDENGVLHDANIIWGNSAKPALEDDLEVIVVATGFEVQGETMADEPITTSSTMVTGIPSIGTTNSTTLPPRTSETTNGAKHSIPGVPRPMTPVVLGARKNRFMQLEEMKKTPAYVRRKSPMKVMDSPTSAKVLLNDAADEPTKAKNDVPSSGDLFSNQG